MTRTVECQCDVCTTVREAEASRERVVNQDAQRLADEVAATRRARSLAPRYRSQAARDAQAANYGAESYWRYLDEAAEETAVYFADRGDFEAAAEQFTRSLSEALRGNDGE